MNTTHRGSWSPPPPEDKVTWWEQHWAYRVLLIVWTVCVLAAFAWLLYDYQRAGSDVWAGVIILGVGVLAVGAVWWVATTARVLPRRWR